MHKRKFTTKKLIFFADVNESSCYGYNVSLQTISFKHTYIRVNELLIRR